MDLLSSECDGDHPLSRCLSAPVDPSTPVVRPACPGRLPGLRRGRVACHICMCIISVFNIPGRSHTAPALRGVYISIGTGSTIGKPDAAPANLYPGGALVSGSLGSTMTTGRGDTTRVTGRGDTTRVTVTGRGTGRGAGTVTTCTGCCTGTI